MKVNIITSASASAVMQDRKGVASSFVGFILDKAGREGVAFDWIGGDGLYGRYPENKGNTETYNELYRKNVEIIDNLYDKFADKKACDETDIQFGVDIESFKRYESENIRRHAKEWKNLKNQLIYADLFTKNITQFSWASFRPGRGAFEEYKVYLREHNMLRSQKQMGTKKTKNDFTTDITKYFNYANKKYSN